MQLLHHHRQRPHLSSLGAPILYLTLQDLDAVRDRGGVVLLDERRVPKLRTSMIL
jgi:hypothetical protein